MNQNNFLKVFALTALLATGNLWAGQEILLWTNGAPGALGNNPPDKPSITVYSPATNATGAAMVICPGGAYGGLAPHEGNDYALYLNQHGITCFVLKYRLGSAGYRHPCMLWDAARAVRTVRARAAEWGVDPNRIGIMGSSAGGHLAATLLTQYDAGDPKAADSVDRVSSRPDLGVLCYPVITMGTNTHTGSRANLLGKDASSNLIAQLSAELNVTPKTPPCFLWHTWEDPFVKLENPLAFADALRRNHVPFDLHIYQKGTHGIGLVDKQPPFKNAHPWARDLVFWLQAQGFTVKK